MLNTDRILTAILWFAGMLLQWSTDNAIADDFATERETIPSSLSQAPLPATSLPENFSQRNEEISSFSSPEINTTLELIPDADEAGIRNYHHPVSEDSDNTSDNRSTTSPLAEQVSEDPDSEPNGNSNNRSEIPSANERGQEEFIPAPDTISNDQDETLPAEKPYPEKASPEPDSTQLNQAGYQVIEGPDGPELIYSPQHDMELEGKPQHNPILGSYREFERRNMLEALHRFLTQDLNQMQRELLQEHLIEQATEPPKSTAAQMSEEMRSQDLSPESFAQLTRLAIALFYYRNYIYRPLIEFAGGETDMDQEGLIMPHVMAMSEQLADQWPQTKPFINFGLVLPIALRLFYSSYSATDFDSQVKAYSTSSYALTLGLLAQASAGFLTKFTSFQSYPAGMLASAYRNWRYGDLWQVAIDGFMTLQYLKQRRGLIFAAMGAAFLSSLDIPKEDVAARGHFEHLLDANYMIPLILTTCMTQDWGSSFVTGIILATNQLVYRARPLFLERGHFTNTNQPYWAGLVGSSLAIGATLAVYWKNIPSIARAGEALNYLTTEASDWLGYLLMIKGITRPDWERSGTLHWATGLYSHYLSSENYQGEYHVETEYNYSSEAERLQEEYQRSITSRFSEWFSYLMGYIREPDPELKQAEPRTSEFTHPNTEEGSEIHQEETGAN